MLKTQIGAITDVEPGKSTDINVLDLHDGDRSIMVHVSGDHIRSVDAEQYNKKFIEKQIQTTYRRFTFHQSGIEIS